MFERRQCRVAHGISRIGRWRSLEAPDDSWRHPMSDLHPNVVRVQDALLAAGAKGSVRMLDESARTAAEAAAALGVEVGQITNSLIFVADGEPLLVLTSGRHRVD